MESEQGSSFLFEHDLFRPSFARRSGLREGGNPVPTFRDHALNQRSAILTCCAFIGSDRIRLPVAWAKALAIAAAVGPCEASPAPSGRSFCRLSNSTVTLGTSGMV